MISTIIVVTALLVVATFFINFIRAGAYSSRKVTSGPNWRALVPIAGLWLYPRWAKENRV